VLNWLLVGLHRVTEQQKFSGCQAADVALADFRKHSDSVQLFIDEYRLEPSKGETQMVAELYSLYKIFCHNDGYKQLSKNNFSKRFKNKGFEPIRLSGGSRAFLITARPEDSDAMTQ